MLGIMVFLLVFAAGVVCAQTEEPSDPPALTPPAPEPTPAPVPPSNYKDFTSGERVGTWALNAFVIPGLGSYVMMQDVLGGTIQLVAGGVGIGLGIASIVVLVQAVNEDMDKLSKKTLADPDYDNTKDTVDDPMGSLTRAIEGPVRGLLIAAIAVNAANSIFNIVRSATYHKPQPKVGSIADPNAWSLVVLPGDNGVEQVRLAYTLRY